MSEEGMPCMTMGHSGCVGPGHGSSTLVFKTFETSMARLEIYSVGSFVAPNVPNPRKVRWYYIG